MLAGAPLHVPAARAGTSLAAAAAQPPAAEGSQALQPEASSASQAEPGGRGSSMGGGGEGGGGEGGSGEGGSHLVEHVEQAMGCLRAAYAQGLLTREAILQVFPAL